MASLVNWTMAILSVSLAAVPLRGAVLPTSTTLTLSPGSSVVAGTVVTLTASVADPFAVTKGTVIFCNALMARCEPFNGLYDSAQLTSSGTASIHLRFGAGINNIKATFIPTTTHAGSTSSTASLGVSASPIYPSYTTLSSTGVPDNYNLTGTVTSFGGQILTGGIRLLDISNGDLQLAATSLGTPAWTLAPVSNTSQVFSFFGIPIAVAVGDFNGDGKLDLATVNDDDHGLVAVQLGNGDGSFQPSLAFSTGVDPVFVAVGDFNSDGVLDLVVANSNGNNVVVLLGNGDGTFQAPIEIATDLAPISIAVGDFNADGRLDLAVANHNSGTVSILLGNGDGTFEPQNVLRAGSGPEWVGVNDFNGDGNIDLAVVNSLNNSVSVFLGNGDGTFQAAAIYPTGFSPTRAASGDFNHDGNADLVIANATSNDVSVLLGNGDGSFRPQTRYATGSLPVSIAVSDFDGDGNLDMATASAADGGPISILLGGGDGTFQTATTYAANTGSPFLDSVAAGDFNGDGKVDLASASGASVRVLLGEQVAPFGLNGVSVPGTGAQNVLALYSGDNSRSESQSNVVVLVGLAASMTTLTSSQPSMAVGETTLLTARVTSGATGLVSFAVGGVQLGSVALDGTGTAVLSTQFNGLAAGSYIVTASYTGNASFAASSASITETLSLASSSVQVSSSTNPSSYGSLVTFTATTNPGATGTITFKDGVSIIGVKTLTAGVATISISTLAVGDHTITAAYGGDAHFAASASQGLQQIINKAPINMTLMSSESPSVYGDKVIFTTTVTPGATGSVTFLDGNVILGIATLDASGRAAVSTAALSAGSHNIAAIYSGDSNYF